MTRPCKIGVQLPEVERFVPWPELIAMARSAEEVGFDSIWLGDHLLYDLPDGTCLLYTSPSPRDRTRSRMPSSA